MIAKQTLRGMATVSFWSDDVKAATKWYAELLGIEPYFVRPNANDPSYVEFRLGDFQAEFGIIDQKYAPKMAGSKTGGVVLYWHVDEVAAVFERVKSMGATEYEPLTERGEGFVTASVIDPFGNVLGIMYNPHYMEVVRAKSE
jgi:predicted enzyme related to lactoylglutathione lyase